MPVLMKALGQTLDVHQFLSDGVVSLGEVVGSIFLCVDKILRVEQRSTCSSSNVVNGHYTVGKELMDIEGLP